MGICELCSADAEDERTGSDVTLCMDCHLFFFYGVQNIMDKDQSANRRERAGHIDEHRPAWHARNAGRK